MDTRDEKLHRRGLTSTGRDTSGRRSPSTDPVDPVPPPPTVSPSAMVRSAEPSTGVRSPSRRPGLIRAQRPRRPARVPTENAAIPVRLAGWVSDFADRPRVRSALAARGGLSAGLRAPRFEPRFERGFERVLGAGFAGGAT